MTFLLIRWLVLACAVLTPSLAYAAGLPVLPTISAENLNKATLTLPADLHSDRNVLLLYFQRTQQPEVDQWTQAIDHWRTLDPSLTGYAVLVSPAKNFLARWWQNASMRSASADSRHWDTTLPIYVDKKTFDRQLEITSEAEPVLLVVNRRGEIVARVAGPPSDPNRAAMRAALESAGSPLLSPAPEPSQKEHGRPGSGGRP